MEFKNLPDHKKEQVLDLLQRTLGEEEFTQQTFNDMDEDVIDCFDTSLSNALDAKCKRNIHAQSNSV